MQITFALIHVGWQVELKVCFNKLSDPLHKFPNNHLLPGLATVQVRQIPLCLTLHWQ